MVKSRFVLISNFLDLKSILLLELIIRQCNMAFEYLFYNCRLKKSCVQFMRRSASNLNIWLRRVMMLTKLAPPGHCSGTYQLN